MLSRINLPGGTVRASGEPPLSVVIGNAAGVRFFKGGEPVDLATAYAGGCGPVHLGIICDGSRGFANSDVPAPRRQVVVAGVRIGGGAPVVVQSMTNTDTADVDATARQVGELAAGRVGVGAHHGQYRRGRGAVPEIREQLERKGCRCAAGRRFSFQRPQTAGASIPTARRRWRKYRINPGNVGRRSQARRAVRHHDRDRCRYDKPVRIGVNWGSLDPELLGRMMDENARLRAAAGCRAGDARSA